MQELRKSPMMVHLLEALEAGQDIGHYGRLVFAMVAHHFLDDETLVRLLTRDRALSEQDARALVLQVRERGYNPPRRERILEWQRQQDFPICPTPDDPRACNVYSELAFPEGVYEDIQEFYEERAAQHEHEAA
jgi:hypothetical protein